METERKNNWESIPIVITFIGFKKRKKKRKKKNWVSHAGNRTPATAVRAPDPNH